MHDDHCSKQSQNCDDEAVQDGLKASGLQPKRSDQTQDGGPPPPQTYPSDEIDQELRALRGWLSRKLKESRLAEIVTMVTNVMLVLIAGIAAWIYWGQLNQLAHQLPEMQSQTRTAQLAEINSERAWVGLDGPVIADVLQPSPFLIGGHFVVKNFGQGPAIKVMAESMPVWSPGESDYMIVAKTVCEPPIEFLTNTVPHGPKVRSPGPMGFVLFPGQTHVEQVGGGVWKGNPVPPFKHIWFIGCVAYLDQFNSVHWTRFCYENSHSALLPLTEKTPLQPCSLFNDTDSNRDKD